MTDEKHENNDGRLGAFLDHLLSDDEQELFLRDSENRQELLLEKELQTKIDESLRRIYRFNRPNENQPTEIVPEVEFARSGHANIWRRQNLVRIAVAASLFLLAGVVIWQFSQNHRTAPVFQPRPLAEVYKDTVERGFKPYYHCDDEKRFAEVFAMRHGQPLGLATLPPGRRMLGISYLGGLSRKTTAMLCEVDNRYVIVFVENAENDQPEIALANDDPNLNVFSVSKNGLVFYEVSPFRASQMIDYFEFLD